MHFKVVNEDCLKIIDSGTLEGQVSFEKPLAVFSGAQLNIGRYVQVGRVFNYGNIEIKNHADIETLNNYGTVIIGTHMNCDQIVNNGGNISSDLTKKKALPTIITTGDKVTVIHGQVISENHGSLKKNSYFYTGAFLMGVGVTLGYCLAKNEQRLNTVFEQVKNFLG